MNENIKYNTNFIKENNFPKNIYDYFDDPDPVL